MKHNAECNIFINLAIDVQNLSNVQEQAGKFMKDKVPSIRDAVFGQGEQDNDFFKYQFVSEEAPMTVT